MAIIDSNEVRLFNGRSNPVLAASIARHLDIPLEETVFSKFSNDNLFVQLGSSVRGRKVYIVQSLTPPVSDHLMELLMMVDIAKSAAAKEVHAIVPYFSYARSDKKDKPRISITARLIADLLQTAGATHFMTMTLHSPQVHGFFGIPADPLTAKLKFAEYLQPRHFDPQKVVVVAPDMGHAKRAANFAQMLNLPVASADKTRISDSEVQIGGLLARQVDGFEHALVYDDEIATAGTMVELSRMLVQAGIQKITLLSTHGLFLGSAIERIESVPEIVEVVTTDTAYVPPEKQFSRLKILSVGSLFAEAILNNYQRQSLGDLFTYG